MKRTEEHHSIDLCDTCTHVSKASGNGKEIKVCNVFNLKADFPVEKCSDYAQKGTKSLYELEQMATYIEKKKDGIGFIFKKHNSRGNLEEIK